MTQYCIGALRLGAEGQAWSYSVVAALAKRYAEVHWAYLDQGGMLVFPSIGVPAVLTLSSRACSAHAARDERRNPLHRRCDRSSRRPGERFALTFPPFRG